MPRLPPPKRPGRRREPRDHSQPRPCLSRDPRRRPNPVMSRRGEDDVTATTVRSTNPSRPGDVVVEVPAAGPDDVAKAAQAARAAQKEWQATPPAARSAALAASA